MKYAIRAKMFETNSSSVHAIVVLSEDQYNTWKQNQLYLKLPEPPNVPYNLGEVEIEGMWTLEQVDNLIYEETKNEQFGYLT